MIATAALIAFVTTTALTPLFRALGVRLGVLDRPNVRSSHILPTPRIGGCAIVLGIFAGLSVHATSIGISVAAILTGSAVIVLTSLADDVWTLSGGLKLILHLAAAGVVAIVAFRSKELFIGFGLHLEGMWSVLLIVLWIAGVTNAVNFMDGINGIASVQGAITATALTVFAVRDGRFDLAVAAAAAGAAALAFLPWNFPKASIFMGDAGAATLGFLFGSLTIAVTDPERPLIIAALPLAPFLIDTGVTLVRRSVNRERVLSAHRTHFYQRLVQLGWSHAAVTTIWAGLAFVSAVVALVADELRSTQFTRIGVAAVVLLHVVVGGAITAGERRVRASQRREQGSEPSTASGPPPATTHSSESIRTTE